MNREDKVKKGIADSDKSVARLIEKVLTPLFPKGTKFTQSIGKRDSAKDVVAEIINEDFGLPEKTVLLEVKENPECLQTGNVCIEWQCSGKDSGVLTSKADWWIVTAVYLDKTEVYAVPLSVLTERLPYWANFNKPCGDPDGRGGRCGKGLMVPVEKFATVATLIATDYIDRIELNIVRFPD